MSFIAYCEKEHINKKEQKMLHQMNKMILFIVKTLDAIVNFQFQL